MMDKQRLADLEADKREISEELDDVLRELAETRDFLADVLADLPKDFTSPAVEAAREYMFGAAT